MGRRGRLKTPGLVLGLAVAAAAVVAAVLPWRLDHGTIERMLAAETPGLPDLDVRVGGRVALKLLPRPRLQMTQVSARDRSGALLLDVPEVKAELDIPSLLHGIWRLASATLVEPTLTVDVDRAGDLSFPGPRREGEGAPSLRLRTRSGVLRTISANPAADLVLTGIDSTVIWPGASGALSGSGTFSWRGAPARVTVRVEHPFDLVSASGSAASLQVTSPVLTLSADGVLSREPHPHFAGHLGALVPSLPNLLQIPASTASVGAGRIQIAGDVLASPHGLSFSDASFRMNRGRFEGTLAIRRDDARTAIEGTLATDLLDVGSLLRDDAGEGDLASLYQRPLVSAADGADIDVRISAGKARLGRLVLEDAALSVLFRDGRLDVGIDDAELCGGRVKGRAVAHLGPETGSARAEASAAKVDVAALSAMRGGDGQIGGTLSGDATLESTGRNLGEMVAASDGHGQITVDKGRLAGLALGRALSRFGARLPIQGIPGDRATVCDKAVWAFSVDNGVLKIPDGRLTAPGVAMTFSGETHLPDGRVDIAGTAVETDPAGALVSGSPRLPFTMRGSWDASVVLVGHAGSGGLPSLVLPLVGAPRNAP